MNTSISRGPVRANTLLLGAVVGLAGYFTGAAAQTGQQGPNTPLPTLPGLTVLQQPVANAIDVACPNLLFGIGVNPNPSGTPQERLTNSCTAMVVTAAYLQGNTSLPAKFDLKISNEQLRTGLQANAPGQMNAQGSKNNNLLAGRLFDLRAGARGFAISLNGIDVPDVASAKSGNETLRGATGGAAAADAGFGGRWGGFVKLAGNWGNVDQTTLQDSYKYDSFSVLAGADYRVSDALVLGGAISYDDTKSDYDHSLGSVKAQTWSIAGYGTYSFGKWYVDGFAGYGSINYDTTRNILIPSNNPAIAPLVGSATASPNGEQWSVSLGGGYNYDMGGMSLVPFARLGYIWVRNDSFSENEPGAGLGLDVSQRTVESLQSALGATISTTVSSSAGVFTPYFTAQWMHEFKNDSPSILAKYVNDPLNTFFFIPSATPTRDYAVLLVGSGVTLPNGFSGFLQLGAAAGLKDATNYSVVAGLRKEF